MNNKRVFLDYASATSVDPKVLKKMKPFFCDYFANPSALYKESVEVKKVLDEARQKIATICRVKKHEVIFTAGGTESINLALLGSFKNSVNRELITVETEHPAIIESAKEIERLGSKVHFLQVDKNGKINIKDLHNSLNEKTYLISVMLVNNEIGNIMPIKKISSEIKKYKNKIGRNFNEPPFLHTDASQAPNFLEIDFDKLGVDLMTLDGSKIYGPKGVGCLIKKDHVLLEKINFGGSQEFGQRSGTENVASIVGFAKALEIADSNREIFSSKMKKLQNYFFEKIRLEIPQAKINGDLENRIPNNVNICIPKLNSEFAVIQLDNFGVACSSVTACKSINSDSRSYVVGALDSECGASSIRFTMGRKTSKSEIDFTVKVLKKVLEIQKIK